MIYLYYYIHAGISISILYKQVISTNIMYLFYFYSYLQKNNYYTLLLYNWFIDSYILILILCFLLITFISYLYTDTYKKSYQQSYIMNNVLNKILFLQSIIVFYSFMIECIKDMIIRKSYIYIRVCESCGDVYGGQAKVSRMWSSEPSEPVQSSLTSRIASIAYV